MAAGPTYLITNQDSSFTSSQAGHSRAGLASRVVPWVVAGVTTVLVLRLGRFVDRYAINVLYWDQWDFLQGLFDGADAWSLFRVQHGPQRQGLGNLIYAVLYPASGWNARADAAANAFVMLLAALVALWVIRRLTGSLRAWDIAIPLLFLTTTNVETYVLAPNIAHGPLPALLMTLYALALTIRVHELRCAGIVAANFAAVNTGFTVLIGGITPPLLLLFACLPALTRRARAVYIAGVAASLGTVALFLDDFVPVSATTCFQFPHPQPLEYVPYAGFVLGRTFGLDAAATSSLLLSGTLVTIGGCAFAAYAAYRFLATRGESVEWAVVSVLTGFTVLFAATTAVGRVCLGMPSAHASRYIPYVLLGLFGVYVAMRTWSGHPRLRTALLTIFLVACVAKERSRAGSFEATNYSMYKQQWVHCYFEYHDIAECDARAGHPIYPNPDATQLQRKLDWLEARGLNLFQERDSTAITGRRSGE